MALYSDPEIDELVDNYFSNGRDPRLLYQGSNENITEKLKAWIPRRKQVYKEQLELRDQAQESTKLGLTNPRIARDPEYVSKVVSRHARIKVVDNEANMDCARAVYLLETLKSRGFTWPMFWWQPDIDGGVCGFLGTIDKDFDPYATLTILEAKEEEKRLQATAAEINAQIDAKFTRFGRRISEEGLRAMWAAMAKGEACSTSSSADEDWTPVVVGGAEDEPVGTMDAMPGGDDSNNGGTKSSKGKKQPGQGKRVAFSMEATAKEEEDTQMED